MENITKEEYQKAKEIIISYEKANPFPEGLTDEEKRATEIIKDNLNSHWMLGSISGMGDIDTDDNFYYICGGIARKWSNLKFEEQARLRYYIENINDDNDD
jgi:hypothetical protein